MGFMVFPPNYKKTVFSGYGQMVTLNILEPTESLWIGNKKGNKEPMKFSTMKSLIQQAKGEDKRLEKVQNEMNDKGQLKSDRSERLKDFVKQAQRQIKRLKKLK